MQRASQCEEVYTDFGCSVATQRRRAGHRPGELSAGLRAAIENEARRLSRIESQTERVNTVGDTFAALDEAMRQLAMPRLEAIAELRREGWSYDRIAAETTLSKGRVAQLAREAKSRGL